MNRDRFPSLRRFHEWLRMAATFHVPGGSPDIFLFSTPRSGSTWLMELIMSQPGFQWCSEPFDLRKDVVRETLGIQSWEDLQKEESSHVIKEYLDRHSRGNIRDARFKYPSLLRGGYRMVTRRKIFKILHGLEDRASWVERNFGGEIIFLVRHPLPVSLSRREFPRLESYFNSDYQSHFSPKQITAAKGIVTSGTQLEKGVLDWCVQNALLLRQVDDGWVVITYEQLVLEPEKSIAFLVSRLGLSRPQRMMKMISRPSGSTTMSDKETQERLSAGKELDRNWLVGKWRNKIRTGEEIRLMRLLELFEVDLYSSGELKANKKYWIS